MPFSLVVTCVMYISSSGASMYNFNDEEEDDDGPTKEKVEENEQLKEKMKQVRLKMDKLNISKKVGLIFLVALFILMDYPIHIAAFKRVTGQNF